jgi:arylsulfatase A-like enzyme/Flp pilus assembly protein TadD
LPLRADVFFRKIHYNFIMRIIAYLFLLLAMLTWPAFAAAAPDNPSTSSKPLNVLLITIDTWRFDRLGSNNPGFVKTPHLDAMAGRGINFVRSFAHNPMTLPSHANIFTGVTALTHGVYDNNGFKLNEESLTLAEHLKNFDYQTFAVVSSFVLSKTFGLNQGFAEYLEPVEKDAWIAEEVVSKAMRLISQQRKKWFGWVHLWDCHFPYTPPEPFAAQYKNDLYSGEVAYVDSQLGKLFAFLEEAKILDNTILIITGDHGEALGEHGEYEHGFFAYNSTMHIPLILVAPGYKKKICDAYVCHLDIFPTLCQELKIPAPKGLQGLSLLAEIQHEPKTDRTIYFESRGPYFSKGWAPLEGYIYKKKKYINLPIKELYDLDNDFSESKNIISQAKIAELAKTLRNLKDRLSGNFKDGSRLKLSAEARQKLETFGYLSGFKQETKNSFGREDDLKTLLPLQNMLRQAKQFFNNREYDQAALLCEKVLSQKPQDVATIIQLADTYMKLKKIKKAMVIIQNGLLQVPGNIELQVKLGGMLAEGNASEKALSLLNEILLAYPKRGDAWNFLGITYFRRRDYDKALNAYNQAVALDPSSALAQHNLGTLYLTLFIQKNNRELLAKAIASFNLALLNNPQMEAAYNGRGTALKFSRKNEAAIADWKKAIALSPDFIDPYFNIGITYLESGNKTAAFYYLNTCLEKYSGRLSANELQRLQRLLAEAKKSE